jgi:predicted RNA binding protein YcfA (HicA-like mRNA interferase family)
VTRLAKLYARFLARQALSFSELERLLRGFDFYLERVTGSHHIYVHRGTGESISIQPKGKDAKTYQLRQVRDMIEELGLELDENDDG